MIVRVVRIKVINRLILKKIVNDLTWLQNIGQNKQINDHLITLTNQSYINEITVRNSFKQNKLKTKSQRTTSRPSES